MTTKGRWRGSVGGGIARVYREGKTEIRFLQRTYSFLLRYRNFTIRSSIENKIQPDIPIFENNKLRMLEMGAKKIYPRIFSFQFGLI